MGLYDQKKTQSGSKLFQKPDTYPSFQKPESDPIFQKPETDPIFTKPDTDPCFYKPDPDPQPCVARCWLRFNLFDKFGKILMNDMFSKTDNFININSISKQIYVKQIYKQCLPTLKIQWWLGKKRWKKITYNFIKEGDVFLAVLYVQEVHFHTATNYKKMDKTYWKYIIM